MIRITTIQAYSGGGTKDSTPHVLRKGAPGGFVASVLRLVTVLLTVALGAVAAVGVLLVGVGVAALTLAAWCVLSLYGAARRLVMGTRAPNGVLDGRRNVRVAERPAGQVVDQAP